MEVRGAVSGSSLLIQEQDGSPSGFVTTLKVTNGTLTDNGGGTFSLITGGGGGSGISSINADTTSAQTLNVGTSGTDFAISDNGTGTHTFNLPTASATNRGALSSTDWTTFNNKGSGTVTAVTGTSPISVATGTTTAVISISQATATTNGYLSSTDWSTFNSKGSGTVTTVSITTTSGFSGTVANASSTPAISLSVTTTGILKGSAGAIVAAVSGTDYVAPGAVTTSGLTMNTAKLLGRTTAGSGAIEEITVGANLSLSGGILSVSTATSNLVVGTSTVTGGTSGRVLYDNAGVLGEYAITGTSNVVLSNSPTLSGNPVMSAGTGTILTVPTSDNTATGDITNDFLPGYTTAIGDLVYMDSSANWQKANAATSATTYSGLLGVALEVKTSTQAVKVLQRGYLYCSSAVTGFTKGGIVYMSTTSALMTQTAPTATDTATRILGYAVHANKIWFNPSNDYVVHT